MLSESSRIVLDTLLPAGAHPQLDRGLFDAGFEAFHGDFSRTALPSMRLGLRAALLAAVWVSPLLIGKFPPITRLDRDAREQALEAMGRCRLYPVRQLLLLLKAVACFCYGADPEVRRALGYPAR